MQDEKYFLQKMADLLHDYAEEIRHLDRGEAATKKMHELLQTALKQEAELREQYKIGVRFNVVRRQLELTLNEFEKELASIHAGQEATENAQALPPLEDDETLVYVYLFNIQGDKAKDWEHLLLAPSLVDHSVNRPVYLDVRHVEEVLRTRFPVEQHAYIECAVKKSDIVSGLEIKDANQHPLVRLKQGALKVDNVRRFHHAKQNYRLIQRRLMPE